MRNLKLFNKAMLAKQCWRLMTNPNSLMAKILKMNYFPHSEVLDAKVPPNASFIWRSIMSARGVIKLSAREIVGMVTLLTTGLTPGCPHCLIFVPFPDCRTLLSPREMWRI